MRKLVAFTAAALLVPAGAAQAATKQVTVGPAKPLKGAGPAAFNSDFFPAKLKIHKGDSVRFVGGTGFGDAAFVPKGEDVPPFALANPDQPVAGAVDAAGAPMWFNGLPSVVPNVAALSPSGGKTITGKSFAASGLPFDGPFKPWKVKFPKTGRYTFTSVFHPSTEMTVLVKQPGAKIPSNKADAKRVAKQTKKLSKQAKRLAAFEGPAGNVVRAGNDAKGTAQIAFFPESKTVSVGDTVTFAMSKESIESHNVAFGPKDYLDEQAMRFFGEVFDPFVVYPSQPPGTALAAGGAVHGNGYINTGILDADPASPFPAEEAVTFTAPGTYDFYCAIHGNEMKGRIVVQ